jgi:hypothetical protein
LPNVLKIFYIIYELVILVYFQSAKIYMKSKNLVGCWWFTPIILATQEAEIRKIVVRSQPGQIVL